MNAKAKSNEKQNKISNHFFEDQEPELPNLTEEVLAGLTSTPKKLNAMFFYDQLGSELFEAITKQPEYYVTRTEVAILRNNIVDIKRAVGEKPILIEYGSGNSEKIRLLLDQLDVSAYLPIDISKDFLLDATQALADAYPKLPVHAICADYNAVVEIPMQYQNGNKVAFFPGSTIGNFTPDAAQAFLENVRSTLGHNGGLIIGVDMKKDPQVLNNAYNDHQGVTANFNLNMLANLNELVKSDFKLENYEHEAFYNSEAGRIEMHLKSLKEQSVQINGSRVELAANERIHTENSYKYHVEEFISLASAAGFRSERVWIDDNEHFSIHYFQAA